MSGSAEQTRSTSGITNTRRGWHEHRSSDHEAADPIDDPGDGTRRTGPFIGYLVGAGIMMAGGVIEIGFGINAEGKSLETVTKPLTSVVAADEEATLLAILPAAAA